MDSEKNNERPVIHPTEEEILEKIKKERYEVIKMQVDLEFLGTYAQEFVQQFSASNKNQTEKVEKLKTENTKFKEQISNEFSMFSNLKTDIENLVASKTKISEVMQQLNEFAKMIETNATQLNATNDLFRNDFIEKINLREAKEQSYIKEIEKLQFEKEKLTERNQKLMQEGEISLKKQNKEIEICDQEIQNLTQTLQEKKRGNENQKHVLKKCVDKKNDSNNEYLNLQETVTNFTKNHENDTLQLQKEIEMLEEKIKESKDLIFEAQNVIKISQIEHTNLNEETFKIQEVNKKLESMQCEKEDLLFNLETEVKKNQELILENRCEINSKLVSLKEKLEIIENRNKGMKEDLNNNQQSLEELKRRINSSKETLLKKTENKENLIKKLENVTEDCKEFSLKFQQKLAEKEEQINELKQENDKKEKLVKALKEEIDKRMQKIDNIKTEIQNRQIRKKSLEEKKKTLKKNQNEVKDLEKKLEKLESESKTKKSTKENRNKTAIESLETEVKQQENEMKKFKEKMNEISNEKKKNFVAEKRKLEITNKTLNSKINALQNKKEDLNKNITESIQTITEISKQTEMALNIKTSQNNAASQNFTTPRKSTQNFTISTSQSKSKTYFSSKDAISKPETPFEKKSENWSRFSSDMETEDELVLKNVPAKQIRLDSDTKMQIFDKLVSEIEFTEKNLPVVTSTLDQTGYLEKNMNFLRENYKQRHPEAIEKKNLHIWTTDTEISDNNSPENKTSDDSDLFFSRSNKNTSEINSSYKQLNMDKLFDSLK